MPVDAVLIRRVAAQAGYVPTTLEKVARLEHLLREFSRHPELGRRLALKGGTAINFVLLPEPPRLSVDLDFNYLGAIERSEMLADRPRVETAMERIFHAQRYHSQRRATYGATAWTLRFTNIAGNPDTIKVEVNWLLRVPVWTPVPVRFRSLLAGDPTDALALAREEIVAGKVVALLGRASPRDLCDVADLAEWDAMGHLDRVRSAVVLLGSFQAGDFRDRLRQPAVGELREREIRSALWPTLRRDRRPALEELRAVAEPVLDRMLTLGETHVRYLERFYAQGSFDPLPLFDEMDANPDLPRHPVAAWRLRQRDER